MITEMAVLTALPGKSDELGHAISRGIEYIRQDAGCIGAHIVRCVEKPDRFIVTVEWTSLEAHVDDFRKTDQFRQWIDTIKGLFDPQALDTQHYADYPGEQS